MMTTPEPPTAARQLSDAIERADWDAVDIWLGTIRAEAGHKASDHDECGESCEVETLVRSLVARAVRAEGGTLDDWARWIVRQGRNPQPGCPECGPLGMDQAPSLCVPHQALARLAEADPYEEYLQTDVRP